MLPTITREQILDAFQQFDQNLRGSPAWAAWEQNKGHKWAIVHEAQRYPVKQIVALAAGVVPSSFSGGNALNNRVTRLGFVVGRLEERPPITFVPPSGPYFERDPLAAARAVARSGETQYVMLYYDSSLSGISAGWVVLRREPLPPDAEAAGEMRIAIEVHQLGRGDPQVHWLAIPFLANEFFYALGICVGAALTRKAG